MGLLDFVAEHKAGPLFYSTARAEVGKDSKALYKKVGERLAANVRDIGVKDSAVKPNHGWRHRMSSILMRMGCQKIESDTILGHKGPVYGKVDLVTKQVIIENVPSVELDPAKALLATEAATAEARKKRAERSRLGISATGRRAKTA
jgi:hypothetical protein